MAQFIESPRFPGCPSFGFESDPEYSVTITRTVSGREKRNLNWSRTLARIVATVGPRHESEISELLEWWHVVGGRTLGFRVKDYTDFKSCRSEAEPTALDQPFLQLPDSPDFWQMVKLYDVGALDENGDPVMRYREIYKPVEGTILLADNGTLKTEGADYTVDYTRGTIDLAFSPAGTLTWGGEFDLPMRFDSGFPVEVIQKQIEGVSFALQELRQP